MQKNKVSISKKTVLRVIAAVLALLILASFISIIPAGHTDFNIIDLISAIPAYPQLRQSRWRGRPMKRPRPSRTS